MRDGERPDGDPLAFQVAAECRDPVGRAGEHQVAGRVDGGEGHPVVAGGDLAHRLRIADAGDHRALAGLFVHGTPADDRQREGVLQGEDTGDAGGGEGADAVPEHGRRAYSAARPQVGEGDFEGDQGGLAVPGAGQVLGAVRVEEQVEQRDLAQAAQHRVGAPQGAGEDGVGVVEVAAHARVLGALAAEEEGDGGRGAVRGSAAGHVHGGLPADQRLQCGVQFVPGRCGEDRPVRQPGTAGAGGVAQGGERHAGVGREVGAVAAGQGGQGGLGVRGQGQGVHRAVGGAGLAGGRRGAGADSTITWALVPPKPNELTPARRVPPAGRARRVVGTVSPEPVQSRCRLGVARCSSGGTSRSRTTSTALISPAMPAAASRWPMAVFTEPTGQGASAGRPRP